MPSRDTLRAIAQAIGVVVASFVLLYGVGWVTDGLAGQTVSSAERETTIAQGGDLGYAYKQYPSAFTVDPALKVKPAELLESDDATIRELKMKFNYYFVGNKFFDCPDGRNKDRTYLDMNKLVPCVNGSALTRVESGKIQVDEKGSTSPGGIVATTKETSDELDEFCAGNDVLFFSPQWVFTLYANSSGMIKDGADPLQYVTYHGAAQSDEFGCYVSINGSPWEITDPLSEKAWTAVDKVEIVVFWQDLDTPMIDAPTPFKNWTKVQKHIDIPTS